MSTRCFKPYNPIRRFKPYDYENINYSDCKDFEDGFFITQPGVSGCSYVCKKAKDCQNFDSNLCYRKMTLREKG